MDIYAQYDALSDKYDRLAKVCEELLAEEHDMGGEFGPYFWRAWECFRRFVVLGDIASEDLTSQTFEE